MLLGDCPANHAAEDIATGVGTSTDSWLTAACSLQASRCKAVQRWRFIGT